MSRERSVWMASGHVHANAAPSRIRRAAMRRVFRPVDPVDLRHGMGLTDHPEDRRVDEGLSDEMMRYLFAYLERTLPPYDVDAGWERLRRKIEECP